MSNPYAPIGCLIQWNRANHPDVKSPQWGSMAFQKEYDLPFFPRAGDLLYLNESGPFAVESSNFDVDRGYAEVFVDSCDAGSSWAEVLREMEEAGWEQYGADGTAADGNVLLTEN